ncbi:hypothetical protein T02_12689 [Trichinella nativa]|uniref:Uncharacterized protein n=1 Tax=Trichinella nativa TaxID=6335 RepID=A0A0V1KNH1_9BILA|nr:hypothetical protein T02_12689 [Trichinella nativa]
MSVRSEHRPIHPEANPHTIRFVLGLLYLPFPTIISRSKVFVTGRCLEPRASSTRLLARPSLFGDGPVLTGVFPFLSVSRFPDGIATIKQQTMSIYFIKQSETRTDDDVTTNTHTLLWQLAIHVNNHHRTPPPIFMSYSSYGSFSFLPLHFLQEKSH